MKRETRLKISKITFLCAIALLAVAIAHVTWDAVWLYNHRMETSFPWWAAFYFPGIPYAAGLVILLFVSLLFRYISRKKV